MLGRQCSLYDRIEFAGTASVFLWPCLEILLFLLRLRCRFQNCIYCIAFVNFMFLFL